MVTGTEFDLMQFLETVITTPTGWIRFFTRGEEGVESWYQWPPNPHEQLALATPVDVYYSPHLYTEPDPLAPLQPTRTLSLDIGASNTLYLPLAPTVLVQTSANRRQAYWVFNTEVDQQLLEQLALSVSGVDPSSARLGYLLRLPGTLSSKYTTPYPVRIDNTVSTSTTYSLDALIPNPNGHTLDVPPAFPTPVLDGKPLLDPNKPYQYMRALTLSPEVSTTYDKKSSAPYDVLRALARELLNRTPPLPLGNILFVLKHSANNIFAQQTYHQDEELLKFVLEQQHTAHIPDARKMIERIRQVASTTDERHDSIAKIVLDNMLLQGTFLHTYEGGLWYVPKQGETIAITRRSEVLYAHLQNNFNLNQTDQDTDYTIGKLTAFVYGLPKRSYEMKLSHYDPIAQRLLLHTGTNLVWSITPTTIEQVPNGSYGVVLFPMRDIFIPFMPRPPKTPTLHWSETLFGPFLDHITNLDREEARALLASWLLFLFFRNTAPSRPILALLGRPGSGKSTTLKRVCTFLYGKPSGFAGITTPQDFDHATSAVPLAVFDNVDTWEKWLPDRIAQSAGVLETPVRKYYTNTDTVIIRRDAMVALSAHDPKFSRADVADRLLILNMERSTRFIKEQTLMQMPRPALWYQVIQDLQTILATPLPEITEQLRVEDFAAIGSWIAKALGLLPEFRRAISKLRGGQRSFAIESEQLLIDAIITYLDKKSLDWKLSSAIYSDLEWASKDGAAFIRKYHNSGILSKRLVTLQEALHAVCTIEHKVDEHGRDLWRITPRS